MGTCDGRFFFFFLLFVDNFLDQMISRSTKGNRPINDDNYPIY